MGPARRPGEEFGEQGGDRRNLVGVKKQNFLFSTYDGCCTYLKHTVPVSVPLSSSFSRRFLFLFCSEGSGSKIALWIIVDELSHPGGMPYPQLSLCGCFKHFSMNV